MTRPIKPNFHESWDFRSRTPLKTAFAFAFFRVDAVTRKKFRVKIRVKFRLIPNSRFLEWAFVWNTAAGFALIKSAV